MRRKHPASIESEANELAFIPFEVICRPCPSTKRDPLQQHVNHAIDAKRKSGELVKLGSDLRNLTAKANFEMAQNPAHELVLQERKERTRLNKLFLPIAGRQDRWTLLDIGRTDYLQKVIRETFLPEDQRSILKAGGLWLWQLYPLLVRKHRLRRTPTVKANQRTREQRAEAARKGHRHRRTAIRSGDSHST